MGLLRGRNDYTSSANFFAFFGHLFIDDVTVIRDDWGVSGSIDVVVVDRFGGTHDVDTVTLFAKNLSIFIKLIKNS
jgi:hypothetical protein